MIELKNILVAPSRGTTLGRPILNGIDLKIAAGEFLTVLGSNGAGKSSLLNVISGDCIATGGSIEIDGEDLTQLATPERAHLIARVFQDPLVGSCGDLSVAENMALASKRGAARALRPALNAGLRVKFQEALAPLNMGLESRLDTPMSQLSGGQRQAVSLAMSVLSPMKILLLDEHTSALDPKSADLVMKITAKIIRDHHLTALMVTHSLAQAISYGSRTIILHEGRITCDLSGVRRSELNAHDLLDLYGDA